MVAVVLSTGEDQQRHTLLAFGYVLTTGHDYTDTLNDQYLIYDDKDILRHYLRISSTNLYDLKKAFFFLFMGCGKEFSYVL